MGIAMSEKLVLIDGHSILNRAFYGVPDLSNSKGLHTNAVYGFLNILFKILEEEEPDYLAVAFDVHVPTFRHELYDAYKGTRKPMPQELQEQVPVMKEVLGAMGITMVEQAGLEADDILGTLAVKAQDQGMEVSLVSGDRDLLQIAAEHIKIRIPKTRLGRTEIEDYYPEDVKAAYQVTPRQYIELKALMGDASDNIPGVPKVGEKTATALMAQYGSLENIYAHLEEIPKKSVRESLKENRALADLSLTLATIRTDCGVSLDYEKARAQGFFTKEAYRKFRELEFKNMLGRFEQETASSGREEIEARFRILESPAQLAEILERIGTDPASAPGAKDFAEEGRQDGRKQGAAAGLITLWEKTQFLGAALALEDGSVCFWGGGPVYRENEQLSLFETKEAENRQDREELIRAIQRFTGRVRVYTADIKSQYGCFSRENTENYFDIVIAAYLLNPLKSDYDCTAVAAEHLDLTVPDFKECFGKKSLGEALAQDPGRAAQICMYQAYAALQGGRVLEEKLRQAEMLGLMREIEMPLSLVLYDMEREGVAVKPDELKAYGDALAKRIGELEAAIHAQAGEDFNIQSPRQLGEILFDKLKLPGGKKTRTGYSTAAEVLDKLAPDHQIVRDVLEYRGLTKLKSTYADGLAAYIDGGGRIHTSFNQTITATGRIGSTEPNLQNIPMRMELGKQIRKVFVPREGCVFMDADYSQIELRVLAHMSGDRELIEAYRTDQDIHRITASKVFKTPLDQVTDLQRRNAKAVNFGIVYGISAFGLSQDLSISRREAEEYIRQYFDTYPGIKTFLDSLVTMARERGYAATLFGRRRPVPELKSSNFTQRSFGERVAMNSPIQGTAADIIKIAMIRVYRELKKANLRSRLILQVHDELLIETFREEEAQVREILTRAMQGAAKMEVTLAVDLHTGDNWYDAH